MAGDFDIARFLNIRAANGPSFSPDGRFVGFLSNITGVVQLWQVAAGGGWPSQLTFTNDSVRGVWYSPIRHELIYSMDAGGNERTQLYLLRGIGEGTDHALGEGWTNTDLSRHPQAIHTFGGWSPVGNGIPFSATRENPGRFDIYVQKIDEPEARMLQRGPGGYYEAVGWSPDGRFLLVTQLESNFNQNLFVIDASSGKVRCITPHQKDSQYHSPCWSADGKLIYCASTANDRDLTGLAQIDVDSGKANYLETPEHEVEGVAASPQGRWLAWLVNEDGKSKIRLRDLKSGKTSDAPELPLGVVTHLEYSRDDRQLAFAFDGPR